MKAIRHINTNFLFTKFSEPKMVCKIFNKFHVERRFSTTHVSLSDQTYSTEYNHGLSGRGKGKPPKRKKPSGEKVQRSVNGEILFGLHPIFLALKADRRPCVNQIFVSARLKEKHYSLAGKILQMSTDLGMPVHTVQKEVLDELAGNRPHQGFCMDVGSLQVPEWNTHHDVDFTNNSKTSMPVWVYLHNIQDPMNFGAILRTAVYLNVARILVPSSNSCKLSPVVSKASAGALEIADLLRLPDRTDPQKLFEWWRCKGGEVVGTGINPEGHGNYSILEDFYMHKPTLVVFGNEGVGLSPDIGTHCDRLLTIPSNSLNHSLVIGSLNVSVAAGILLHWIKTSNKQVR